MEFMYNGKAFLTMKVVVQPFSLQSCTTRKAWRWLVHPHVNCCSVIACSAACKTKQSRNDCLRSGAADKCSKYLCALILLQVQGSTENTDKNGDCDFYMIKKMLTKEVGNRRLGRTVVKKPLGQIRSLWKSFTYKLDLWCLQHPSQGAWQRLSATSGTKTFI